MFLAVSILMLHTFMPHDHHEDVDEISHVIEHETASSFFDFIGLAFHFSPSENHLQDFEKSSKDYSFDFLYAASLNWLIELPLSVQLSGVFHDQGSGHVRPAHIAHLRFRGPPQNS